jgi:hypothetical protein
MNTVLPSCCISEEDDWQGMLSLRMHRAVKRNCMALYTTQTAIKRVTRNFKVTVKAYGRLEAQIPRIFNRVDAGELLASYPRHFDVSKEPPVPIE